jgi:hypothetical protein
MHTAVFANPRKLTMPDAEVKKHTKKPKIANQNFPSPPRINCKQMFVLQNKRSPLGCGLILKCVL